MFGPRQPCDLLIGADRYDAVALNRHRLRDRKALIDGDDFAVREDQIRRRLLRTQHSREQDQHKRGQKVEDRRM